MYISFKKLEMNHRKVLLNADMQSGYSVYNELATEARPNATATLTDISFMDKFVITLLPIIIGTGVIGNVINIIIFSKKQMRRSSTYYFLIYLSAFDLLVLMICAMDVFLRYGFQIEIREHSLLLCRLHTFLTYFLIHASSFILMIISVDRALIVSNKAIYFSLLRPKLAESIEKRENSLLLGSNLCCVLRCGIKSKFKRNGLNKPCMNRMDLVILTTLSLLLLLNIHYLFFMNINSIQQRDRDPGKDPFLIENSKLNISIIYDLYDDFDFRINEMVNYEKSFVEKRSDIAEFACYPPEGTAYYAFLSKYFIWIDIIVYSFLPCVIMSICSAIILYRIRTSDNKYLTNVFTKNNQTPFYRRLKRNRQLLYMLLITNLYFLLSSLPYCIMFLLYRGENSESGFGQLFVHVLSYTNNAFNFIFYGVSSQKYRENFAILFWKSSSLSMQANKESIYSNSNKQVRRLKLNKGSQIQATPLQEVVDV